MEAWKWALVLVAAAVLVAVLIPTVSFWIAKFSQMGRMAGHKAFVDSCSSKKERDRGEG